MATIKTSPQAQGVALGAVRKQYPTLSNAAQVAVWKYGFDVCVQVARAEDDGTLRGMQRDAAKKAGVELAMAPPKINPPSYEAPTPALISSTSVARKAITARRDNSKFTARSGVNDAAHDIIGDAPAKAAPAPAPAAAKRNGSTFTKEQLAVMREIAASARKHASK